jgi:hypothetical protein
VLTPTAISFEQDFCIRMAAKAYPLSFQLSSHILEVINFAVEDNPIAGHLVLHRLMTQRGKVEDGQAAVSESYLQLFWAGRAQDDGAGVVGTTMGKR